MDIRILQYFLVTAEEENITRAAERLLMTQPTLSRQLKALEEELNVRLFERSNHRIYLTEEGRLFRRRAQDLVNLVERTKEELNQSEEVAGNLVIGCGEVRSMKELGQVLNAFQKEHPRVKLALHSGNNQDIRDGIDQGRFDLGLLLEPVDMSRYDFIRMKTRERWGVLVPNHSPLTKQKSIEPGDLAGYPVLTILDTMVQKELIAWSGQHTRRMRNRGRYNLTYNAAMLASDEKDVVIALDLEQSYPHLTFIPLNPALELHSVLAWRSNNTSSVAEAFIHFFREFRHAKSE